MTKLYKPHKKSLQIIEAAAFLLITVFVAWHYELGYLLLFIFMVVCLSLLTRLCCAFRQAENSAVHNLHSMSDRRLLLLRRLIDLSFTYESDKNLFYKKFRQAVNIEILKREGVVDVLKGDEPAIADRCEKLTPDDVELFCLISHGFTPRELTVIFDLKNPHSIYVKRHRLRSRLEIRKKRHPAVQTFKEPAEIPEEIVPDEMLVTQESNL